MVIDYWGGFRPGEISKGEGTPLKLHQLEWNPSIKDPKEIIITLRQSKTNRFGQRELVTIECKCGQKRFGSPILCPVHLLRSYLSKRERETGIKPDPEDYIFVNKRGQPFPYDSFRVFLKKAVEQINRNEESIHLDPKYYTPHGLRIGGCTDLSREGTPTHLIARHGRWRSDCWKFIYINLDLIDVARVAKTTVSSLRKHIYEK